jgi:hypothetical protein
MQSSFFFLFFAIIFTIIISTPEKISASVPFEVSLCSGIDCGADNPSRCQKQELSTQTCYINKATQRATRFSCIKNRTWTCFTGRGYLDPQCETEDSRNSMRCSPASCSGSSQFSCNLYLGTIQQYANCTLPANGTGPEGISPCSNCNTTWNLATGSCFKDPNQEGFWYLMDPLMPCFATNVVVRHYTGLTCDDSSPSNYYEEATPSGFCVASGGSRQVSRRLLCHGEDNSMIESTFIMKPVGEIHFENDFRIL